MPVTHPESQCRLFDDPAPAEDRFEAESRLRYVDELRVQLQELLQTAQTAQRMPWRRNLDPIMVRKRFHALCARLPAAEAASLRTAFEADISRLWAIENAVPDGL